MARPLRYTLARVGRWPRILAAVACLLLAGVSALEARHRATAAPLAARTAPVVVSTRALVAGHVLARRDLAIAPWPVRLVPTGSRAAAQRLVGQRLAGPVAAHEPITAVRLVGARLTSGMDADTVATEVELDTDVRAFVGPGDRVDLVATPRPDTDPLDLTSPAGGSASAGAGTLVAQRLLVLAVYRTVGSSPPTAQVVLATSRELALRIAGLSAGRLFTIVGDSP